MSEVLLDQYRSADLLTCDPGALTDLRDISIDPTLPRAERMDAFLRQVRNPYLFTVEGLVVKAVYPSNAGRKLVDALSHC